MHMVKMDSSLQESDSWLLSSSPSLFPLRRNFNFGDNLHIFKSMLTLEFWLIPCRCCELTPGTQPQREGLCLITWATAPQPRWLLLHPVAQSEGPRPRISTQDYSTSSPLHSVSHFSYNLFCFPCNTWMVLKIGWYQAYRETKSPCPIFFHLCGHLHRGTLSTSFTCFPCYLSLYF